MGRLNFAALLRAAAGRQDLVIVILLVVAIAAMVLPITPVIADVLVVLNMGLSVLLLMVAFSVTSPVDFSALPTVILISTVFRLSISIAATRLILLEANSGQVIQTFGDFVIGGNVVVGLVIFLSITIVQFVTITKGSERVAEVAARFSLDGLPGKQMSIDSDVRSGDIDQHEARRNRQFLERESQLFGAMDGAMKFVKGDAIAGIVIVAVNLIGGIAIGMTQHGLSFSDSTHTFSLLTVGEGLVSQIPALFVSLTAGTIVTRVASTTAQNLGAHIVSQVTARPEALRLAGVILLGLAAVPGFPAMLFILLGAVFGGSGFIIARRDRQKTAKLASASARPLSAQVSTLIPTPSGAAVSVVVSRSLFETFHSENIGDKLRTIADQVANDLGFPTPGLSYRVDDTLAGLRYAIEFDMVPEISRTIEAGNFYVPASAKLRLTEQNIAFASLNHRAAREYLAVSSARAAALETASITAYAPSQLIASDVTHVLQHNAAHFLGVQETRRLLVSIENDYKDLIKEVQRVAPIQRIADVLKRLLEEGVPIRNLRSILETILEWASRDQDTVALSNRIRTALRRQICYQNADEDKVIRAFIIDQNSEDTIRNYVQKAANRNDPAIDPQLTTALVRNIEQLATKFDYKDLTRAVVLVPQDLRRAVWTMLCKNDMPYPVLSFDDLATDYSVRTLAAVAVRPWVKT